MCDFKYGNYLWDSKNAALIKYEDKKILLVRGVVISVLRKKMIANKRRKKLNCKLRTKIIICKRLSILSGVNVAFQIPISEALLEKLGFGKKNVGLFVDNKGCAVEQRFNDPRGLFFIDNQRVDYLHLLQNVYLNKVKTDLIIDEKDLAIYCFRNLMRRDGCASYIKKVMILLRNSWEPVLRDLQSRSLTEHTDLQFSKQNVATVAAYITDEVRRQAREQMRDWFGDYDLAEIE